MPNNNHQKLIEKLQKENAPVYNWFVERGIDLTKLGKYITSLSAAIAVATTASPVIPATANKYDLDPNLIFATIMIESGGNTYAIRQEPRINDASYGLGQILYGTARGIGYIGTPTGLFDPAVNIDLIGKYHKRNYDHYQQENLSPQDLTVAYNTGSPYKKAWPGHLKKFDKWYNSLSSLEVDLS